jgi:hypothetical protein
MKNVLTILFVLVSIKVNGMSSIVANCDSFYLHPDASTSFSTGNLDLMRFISKNVVLSACATNGKGDLITKMTLVFSIDSEGFVMDVDAQDISLTPECKQEILNPFRGKQLWNPAMFKGQPVCSTYVFPITCIKWGMD